MIKRGHDVESAPGRPRIERSATAPTIKQAIANKIIALAKSGERNPDLLCEQVLKDIRTPTDVGGVGRR